MVLLGSFAPSLINFRGPLIAEMVRRGHRVIAAAPDIDEATASALRVLGADVRTLRLTNASLNPAATFLSLLQVRRVIREVRPDILIAYTIKPVILAAIVGRMEGTARVIALITGLGYAFVEGGGAKRRISKAVATLLYRIALSSVDLVLFQNRDDQALFRDLGLFGRRTPTAIVDGSGIDVDHFAPAPVPASLSFLMIARLLGDKGVREYARAAARLKAEHPHIPVLLIGFLDPSPDSIDQAELDQMVAAGIEFLGRVEDVRPAIARASVYVLPSYREGTPRSVLEAMSIGRAIITTDAPGCRETVVEGVNGYKVPPRDAEALYRAMLRFVRDPGRVVAMGAQSRRLVETRYDVRKVNADLLGHAGL